MGNIIRNREKALEIFQDSVRKLRVAPASNNDSIQALYDNAEVRLYDLIDYLGNSPVTLSEFTAIFSNREDTLSAMEANVLASEVFARDYYIGKLAGLLYPRLFQAYESSQSLSQEIAAASANQPLVSDQSGLLRFYRLHSLIDYPLMDLDNGIRDAYKAFRSSDTVSPLTTGYAYGRMHFISQNIMLYLDDMAPLLRQGDPNLLMLELASYPISFYVFLSGFKGDPLADPDFDDHLKLILSYIPDDKLPLFDYALSYQLINYLSASKRPLSLFDQFLTHFDNVKQAYALSCSPTDLKNTNMVNDLYRSIPVKQKTLPNFFIPFLHYTAQRYQFDLISDLSPDVRELIGAQAMAQMEHDYFQSTVDVTTAEESDSAVTFIV